MMTPRWVVNGPAFWGYLACLRGAPNPSRIAWVEQLDAGRFQWTIVAADAPWVNASSLGEAQEAAETTLRLRGLIE